MLNPMEPKLFLWVPSVWSRLTVQKISIFQSQKAANWQLELTENCTRPF